MKEYIKNGLNLVLSVIIVCFILFIMIMLLLNIKITATLMDNFNGEERENIGKVKISNVLFYDGCVKMYAPIYTDGELSSYDSFLDCNINNTIYWGQFNS